MPINPLKDQNQQASKQNQFNNDLQNWMEKRNKDEQFDQIKNWFEDDSNKLIVAGLAFLAMMFSCMCCLSNDDSNEKIKRKNKVKNDDPDGDIEI